MTWLADRQNSRNVLHGIRSRTRGASQEAETGSVVVEQAVKQIGNIGAGTTKVGTAIERLNERSSEIEQILSFITEVTSRIRLLSLNASD